ncbi:hypothetical protein BH24ACT23_BH24ACT23_12140 [soil metagenome]
MPRPLPALPRTTRRRFLASSGIALSAPLALAACGAEEAGESSTAENAAALNQVLAAQLALEEALMPLGEQGSTVAGAVPTVERLASEVGKSTAELEDFIAEAEGEPTQTADDVVAAESPTEGLVRQLERAIATEIDAVRELSVNSYRQAVHGYVVENAAALAHLRSILGEDPAPDAFVFGPPAGDEQGAIE